MQTQKEIVAEILELWKNKEYGMARTKLKMSKMQLSSRVYNHMYKKMGIVKNEKTPKILIEAQKIIGGRLLDQYDNEINPPPKSSINSYKDHPWFKK